MAQMNVTAAFLAVALSVGSSTLSEAAAFDCNGLAADLSMTEVGRVYYYQADGGGWQSLPRSNSFASNRVVHLLYVTHETVETSRAGTLVVKTGRYPLDDTQARKPAGVALHRARTEFTNDPCAVDMDTAGYEGRVPAPTYDQYHETDLRVRDDLDRKALDAFHIRYLARRKQCRNTNDTTPDSVLALDFRSNRTQFSFDQTVVENGMRSTVLSALFPRVVAVKVPMADQSVTIRRYQVSSGQAACVQFDEQVTGKGFFLRVNDLEARVRGFLGGLYRTGEQTFVLQQ